MTMAPAHARLLASAYRGWELADILVGSKAARHHIIGMAGGGGRERLRWQSDRIGVHIEHRGDPATLTLTWQAIWRFGDELPAALRADIVVARAHTQRLAVRAFESWDRLGGFVGPLPEPVSIDETRAAADVLQALLDQATDREPDPWHPRAPEPEPEYLDLLELLAVMA